MIFTMYSLQFERALKNLTPNTERATKKQNAIWAGFRKKEESYYFFPDPVILINNEPSLKLNIIVLHACFTQSLAEKPCLKEWNNFLMYHWINL